MRATHLLGFQVALCYFIADEACADVEHVPSANDRLVFDKEPRYDVVASERALQREHGHVHILRQPLNKKLENRVLLEQKLQHLYRAQRSRLIPGLL